VVRILNDSIGELVRSVARWSDFSVLGFFLLSASDFFFRSLERWRNLLAP
jgi:hypothetical protein